VPDFLTDELLAWRARAETLATEHLVPSRDDPTLDGRARYDAVRAASKEAGLYHLTQPGPDAAAPSALVLVVVREALAAHGVGRMRGVFGDGAGVLAGVGEPLRTTHLLPMLAGDRRAGFAFTEPADAPRPTWALVDGDDLVVTGQKSYVTGGGDADFLTATVEVDGSGPAMVVIDTDLPGVDLVRRFASYDGSHHAAFTFEQVRVPRTHLLGAPGEGRGRALARISEVRMAIAADCVGTSMWLLALLEEHLATPRRDGRRPGDQERARLRYGDLRVKAYAARSLLYRTARLVDAGGNTVNECIAAKLFSSEVAGEIVDVAVQLVGGEALVEGHPLEATLRRLRTLRLAEGESDLLRVNVARGRLDLGQGRI
jgi:acyl-CoA dehydrogenase